MYARTSFSVPLNVKIALKKASLKTGTSIPKLALLCLKKLIKSKDLVLSKKINIHYNPDEATGKIYPIYQSATF